MKNFGVSYFIRRFLLLIGLASVGWRIVVRSERPSHSRGANAGWVEIGAESASGHGISKTPFILLPVNGHWPLTTRR